jgi:hypothetical protein
MPTTDMGLSDPSMLGQVRYDRTPLDYYPTPSRATEALITSIEDDLETLQTWEPFCGAGHIAKLIKPLCRNHLATDIRAYEGFDPDDLVDFFRIVPDADYNETFSAWGATRDAGDAENDAAWRSKAPVAFSTIEALKGFRPDTIITNPPYDDKANGATAETSVRHALRLMEAEKGMVIMLLRNEWDAASKRRDLFEHPAFMAKITLRFRPRWIEDSTGSPRHTYAWFIWDWVKAIQSPHARPELRYAG